jgi:hypothetical protein
MQSTGNMVKRRLSRSFGLSFLYAPYLICGSISDEAQSRKGDSRSTSDLVESRMGGARLALQVPEPKSDPSTAILQSYLKNRELQFKHRTSASNRLYCARCRTAARARVPVWSQVAPELADCWRAASRC